MPGDDRSRELAVRLLEAMSEATGLTNRGVQGIRMFSLEPLRNPATYRVMLRLGDNESDSQYLWDSCHREAEAGAITGALGAFLAEHYPLTTRRRATRALQPEAFAGEDPRLVLSQDDHGPTPHRFWHTYPGAPEFVSDRTGDDDVWMVDADGTGLQDLTADSTKADTEPVWSPDGTRIAFTSKRDGRRQVYVMNADGTDPLNVSASAFDASAPSWQIGPSS